MRKQKTVLFLGGVIISVIIIVGIIVYFYIQNQDIIILNNTNVSNVSNETAPKTQNTVKTASPKTQSAPLSYENALKTYTERRLQFSINDYGSCSITPSNASFKKGTSIMLDNRAGKQITIYFDGQPYYVKAYGFKIVALNTSATLPHTMRIDCETGKNNGSILLQ